MKRSRTPASVDAGSAFGVEVRVRRSLAAADQRASERRLVDQLDARGLHFDGAQLAFTLTTERELTPTDQADVLIASLDNPAVRGVRLGPLVDVAEIDAAREHAWLEVDGADPLLGAALSLYEAGRLDSASFLRVLGVPAKATHAYQALRSSRRP